MENHSHSSPQSMSRPPSMSSQRINGATSLSRSLISGLNGAALTQKFPIPGEIQKTLNSAFGMSSGEPLPNSISINHLPSSSVEEIKRLKINLHKNSIVARDRAKAFDEAKTKIEKRQRTLSERSSRSDISSDDLPKVPLQGEYFAKIYHQKNSAESFPEVGRQKADPKAGNPLLNRFTRNPVVETERMSINIQKPTGVVDKNKAISISSNSGPIISEEKLQTLQWGKTKMKKRSVIKSETNVNRNSDTADGNRGPKRGIQRALVSNERQKGNNQGCRPSGIEEDSVASPTSSARPNATARGPRSKTGSLSKASWSIPQMLRNTDEPEPSQSINKVKSAGWATTHKHSANGQSSAPSVPQWSLQKHPKMSQGARKSNLSDIPTHDRVPASGGLSENKESEVSDNKPKFKEKIKKRKIEEAGGQTVQMACTMALPLKKSKLVGKEVKDAVQNRGKNGQDLYLKPRVPVIIEKRENVPTPALQRSLKVGTLKDGSKPARRITKKVFEPKGQGCLKHAENNNSSEFARQPIDDHNVLIAAANAAVDTRRACSGTFWKRSAPFFRFLCSEDIAYLNEQGNSTHVSVSSIPTSEDGCSPVTDGTSLHELRKDLNFDPNLVHVDIEQLAKEVRTGRGVSICQALLSAVIEEDLSNADYSIMEDDIDLSDSSRSYMDDEADIESDYLNLKSMNLHGWDRGSTDGFKVIAPLRCNGIEPNKKLESNGVQLEARNSYTEVEYSQMCIDDRILLELSEIGLYPDPVPDLAQSEEEDVREGINKLEEKLFEQMSNKKEILLRLEKVVSAAREREQKELERVALDKLVEMAYEKYMACWGPRASNSKNSNNPMRQAAFSFIKQTLAQYRQFEERGISCFSDPAFRNIFFSSPSSCSDMLCKDAVLDRETNQLPTAPPSQNYSTGFSRNLSSSIRVHDQEKCLDGVPEQTLCEGQPRSSRVKLLDDVALGGAWKDSTGFGSSLGGTKRKRSARDRELKTQSKDAILGTGTVKTGQPTSSNSRGKGKNKMKSKQKKTQVSSSVESLPSKTSNESLDSTPKSNHPGAMDLGNLQLPETDGADFGGQDLDSWLNLDEEGMQDFDLMGLEIPMDDLTNINLMI